MRAAVYSFTLLCVAYGLVEACYWAIFPLALFSGVLGGGKLITFLIIGVWVLLVIGMVGKVMFYLGRALRQAFQDGIPNTFRSWRYALAIMAMVIVFFAVLPSWFGVRLNDLPWLGSPILSFIGRLSAVLLAIAALPNSTHDLRQRA